MDLILEIPNNISSEKCKEIVKRFEADPNKKSGITTSFKPHPIKRSLDLPLSKNDDESKDIDEYLHKQLSKGIAEYNTHTQKLGYSVVGACLDGSYDNGYQIQKTTPGDFYSWHHDSYAKNGRFLTFIWYLTTHDPMYNGGATSFHPVSGDGGKIIAAETGKLIIFPATWTYVHMGLPLYIGDPKYICTGWIHSEHV